MLLAFFLTSETLFRAGGKLKKAGRERAVRRAIEDGDLSKAESADGQEILAITLSAILMVVFVAITFLYFVGLCTIFNRSNPDLKGGMKIGAYILLALQLVFLGDIYILYFVVRMGIRGLRREADYRTLPFPAPFFRPKKGSEPSMM